MPVRGICSKCGYIASQELCKACILLEGLNRGLPRLGIGKATGSNLSVHIKKLQLKEKGGGAEGVAKVGGGAECMANEEVGVTTTTSHSKQTINDKPEENVQLPGCACHGNGKQMCCGMKKSRNDTEKTTRDWGMEFDW